MISVTQSLAKFSHQENENLEKIQEGILIDLAFQIIKSTLFVREKYMHKNAY